MSYRGLDGKLGLEPRSRVPKTLVLPLDDFPKTLDGPPKPSFDGGLVILETLAFLTSYARYEMSGSRSSITSHLPNRKTAGPDC